MVKIFMFFVIFGTYFLCAFSTDYLWLGQTGVTLIVFSIIFSILGEIIDDYLAKDRWKITWISLTLAFVFSFIFYFSWNQKITTYIFGILTLITFLAWRTKIYQIKINSPIFIKNKPKMKKRIGVLLRIHGVLQIFIGLSHYDFYLRMFNNLEIFIELLSFVIFISLEFLIANLLINGADPNIFPSKNSPPVKKTPTAKKTPPIKKAPLKKFILNSSETFDPAKDTQLIAGYMMELFREDLNDFKSSGYQLIDGNFLTPPDHMLLINKLNLTKTVLQEMMPELIEKITDNQRVKYLEMAWGAMIENSLDIELEKFLKRNDIKLIKSQDQTPDDPSIYMT